MTPVPVPNELSKPYWENAQEGRLVVQRCTTCRHWNHPPALYCPSCGSSRLDFEAVSGRGEVYQFVVVHRTKLQGFENIVPYVAAAVELVEQSRLILVANLLVDDPGSVFVGLPVTAVFKRLEGGFVLPQFQPANI